MINVDARHCASIGSDSRVQVNLNGAASTLNWTLKNWFLFGGGFDIRSDTGGSIVNTGNANVFWEGSFESLDLDELLGGTGHSLR